jgi:hypothetical protein
MMDRRGFIKKTVAAGLLLGGGAVSGGCRALTRDDLPLPATTGRRIPMLDETAATILHLASLAPSGHNSQPWRVRLEGPRTWMIEADGARRLPAVDPDNRELLLSMGAFIENLSLAAGAMGLGVDLDVAAGSSHDPAIARVNLTREPSTGYPLQRLRSRRTVKRGMLAREITAADVAFLGRQTGGRLVYFPKDSTHAACVRDAAVENYRIQAGRDDAQRELVDWLRLDNRDAARYRDGLTPAGMEITGLKGWFVRHFVDPGDFLKPSYRRQGVDLMAELARQGGGWMVIVSPGETVADLTDTGRRFQRMALRARERRIAIHPMTQVLEESHGLTQIEAHHGGNLSPQFVLRVGYLDGYPDPVSLRRPVEWFVYA